MTLSMEKAQTLYYMDLPVINFASSPLLSGRMLRPWCVWPLIRSAHPPIYFHSQIFVPAQTKQRNQMILLMKRNGSNKIPAEAEQLNQKGITEAERVEKS